MVEMDKLFCFLLAGGEGSRLKSLTKDTCKPMVKICSYYHLIDFSLLNCLYSNVFNIAIIVQYEAIDLIKYLIETNVANMSNLFIVPPETKFDQKENIIYKNTAHSVYMNKNVVGDEFEDVLVLSADHIYSMDYSKFYADHKNNNADLSVAYVDVPIEEAYRFGIFTFNEKGDIKSFDEKPKNPKSNHASLGVYIFKKQLLFDVLDELVEMIGYDLDFGGDIIPYYIGKYNVNTYKFDNYWKDLGTVQAFWQINMGILDHPEIISEAFNYSERFKISQDSSDSFPPFFEDESNVSSSIIGKKSYIGGKITHSVIGNGVRIHKNVEIKNSVLMDNCIIKKGVTIKYAVISQNNIIDKDVIGDKDNIILI